MNNYGDTSAFEKAAGVSASEFGSIITYLVMGLFLVLLLKTLISAYQSWAEEEIRFWEMKHLFIRSIVFFCIVSSLLGFS